MGKTENQQAISTENVPDSERERWWGWAGFVGFSVFVKRAFNFKCFFVLLLSGCIFLSALFWLPPFHPIKSVFGVSDAEKHAAPVQASFLLQKPVSLLTAETKRLEYDILEEIGVPNTTVSIISLHPLTASNWTSVNFGILPEPRGSPINPVVLSVLRSSLVELVLKQWNLTLTPSIFGQPLLFGVLKFPGGITVVPPRQTPSLWQVPQILFNFTLNNPISQIQQNLDQLKDQLKFGLRLRSYENLYVQMTNLNGSTLAPPAIVQASVLSDMGSPSLLPQRLRQLAQAISASPVKNLGLNHSIFGKVKQIQLSSYLQHSLSTAPSPSPSPLPVNPYPSEPPVSESPAFSPYAPTPSRGTVFPPESIYPYVPAPESGVHSPSPLSPESPAPSVISRIESPRKSPCKGFPVSQNHLTPAYPDRPAPSGLIPSAAPAPRHRHMGPTSPMKPDTSPSPAVFYGPSPSSSKKNANAPGSWLSDSSPTLPPLPSSSNVAGPPWLMWVLGALAFHLLF